MRKGGPIDKQRQRIADLRGDMLKLDNDHAKARREIELRLVEAEAALAVMVGSKKRKAPANETPLLTEKAA